MQVLKYLAIYLILATAINAHAVSISDEQANMQADIAFLQCVDRNTNSQERKDLAIWVFTALSAHSDFKSLTLVNQKLKTESEQKAAKIFARLLSKDCKAETITSSMDADTLGSDEDLNIHKANYKILITFALKAVSENKEARQSVNHIIKETHSLMLKEKAQ